MQTILNVKQLKQYSKSKGYHFFNRGAMSCFGSKVYPIIRNGANEVYFVTGERMFDDRRRLYTARVMYESGDVLSAFGCEFQQFKTAKAAQKFIDEKLSEHKGD